MSCPCEMVDDGTVPVTGSGNAYVKVGDQGQCCVVASDVWNAPCSQFAL